MSATYPELNLYINGKWRKSGTSSSIPVLNPATEEVLGQLTCADENDVTQAIQAATTAFQQWKRFGPTVRADILRKTADYLKHHQETLAGIITLELGKPLAESYVEVAKASEHFQWA